MHIERLARETLDYRLNNAREDSPTDRYELDYMSTVLGAAKALDIAGLQEWELPIVGDNEFYNLCRRFRAEAEHFAIQLKILSVRRAKQYSIKFDAAAKLKLRHFLTQMREVVEHLEIDVSRKARLIDKINKLEHEIDRDRTRLEVFADLVITGGGILGEAAQRAEPFFHAIERMSAAIYGYQLTEEQSRLPAPEDRKRIEGPRPKGSKPWKKQASKDDMPF